MIPDAELRRRPRQIHPGKWCRTHRNGCGRTLSPTVEIGLNAAILGGQSTTSPLRSSCATKRSEPGSVDGLPSGPLLPVDHRNARKRPSGAWLTEQTVPRHSAMPSEAYTFADRGRHDRPGDVSPAHRFIGYLALTLEAATPATFKARRLAQLVPTSSPWED